MSNTSAPAPRFYVVTLSADEVESVEAHLGRALGAKLVPAPRKPATSKASRPWRPVGPAPTQHQHLTPEAEAWLAKRHDPAFVPRPISTPAIGNPPKLTDKQRAREESAWRSYAEGRAPEGYVEALSRHVAMLDALGARA